MVNVLKVPRNTYFTTNAGNIMPEIQGMQKRGPDECIRKYSPQFNCSWVRLLVLALLR